MEQLETTLLVSGMSCGSCVRHIDGALRKIPLVQEVDVDLWRGTVRVRHHASVPIASLREAVRAVGYDVA